jgi:hypothetical protein
MLILGVPHAKTAGSQRLSIYIFSAMMIVVFSLLVSLFRVKNSSAYISTACDMRSRLT